MDCCCKYGINETASLNASGELDDVDKDRTIRDDVGMSDQVRVEWIARTLGIENLDAKRLHRLWEAATEGIIAGASIRDSAVRAETIGEDTYRVLSVRETATEQGVSILVRENENALVRGAFKTVHLAVDIRAMQACAVKTLHSGHQKALVEAGYDLQEEAQRINEGIAKIRFRTPDYVVEQWGDYSLDSEEVLSRFKGASDEVWRLAYWFASTLEALHLKGIMHLDIKPDNVLFSILEDSYLLIDFDIAQKLDVQRMTDSPSDMQVTGSFGYMAPELMGGKIATPVADAFSVGATLFELYYGRPWRTGSLVDLILSRERRETLNDAGREQDYRDTAGLLPATELSPLDTMLLSLLHPDPQQRMPLADLV
ncbi:hypothetical protein SCG7086_BH_00110 [Chlamydiales bacterium SCGC AG-110-P3]|nr:hypothetical protein SCG7086_BH_00110 [Chlamydiales bacterium SCGC AG-110-P3]